jgi:hypothetical protein
MKNEKETSKVKKLKPKKKDSKPQRGKKSFSEDWE